MTEQKDFSEHTACVIDQKVHTILLEMKKNAKKLLKQYRAELDTLGEAVLEHETLEVERRSINI